MSNGNYLEPLQQRWKYFNISQNMRKPKLSKGKPRKLALSNLLIWSLQAEVGNDFTRNCIWPELTLSNQIGQTEIRKRESAADR